MRNILNQYFTEEKFSKLLVSFLSTKAPDTILELGIGDGSLVRAASNRWKGAQFYGADVDIKQIKHIKEQFPYIKVSNIDGLSSNIEEQLNVLAGNVDIAVCNPPYRPLKKTEAYLSILRKSGFKNSCNLHKLTTDILFFAQNFKMLKMGGELGIILPDTLLSGSEFELFRKDILLNSTITGIIQLPMNAFSKTEARTHILLVKKGLVKKSSVSLKLSDLNGNIISKINVNSNSLLKRMDYSYHEFMNTKYNNGTSLKKIGAKIIRGKFSKKYLNKTLGQGNFFHTTSFSDKLNKGAHFKKRQSIYSVTKKGDILIARVGKGSIGKVTFVKSGVSEISDCVIAVRVEKKYQAAVYESLKSEYGQSWLFANSRGVCSRFITQSDLFDYVINIKD